MSSEQWVAVARMEDIPPGAGKELVAGDRLIALFNIEGTFYALDGVCPHQGGPLGKGCLAGPVVTCPWHGWQFDVRDGQHQFAPTIRQPALPARVEAGQIWVRIDEGE